jgi:hypothetical protein
LNTFGHHLAEYTVDRRFLVSEGRFDRRLNIAYRAQGFIWSGHR